MFIGVPYSLVTRAFYRCLFINLHRNQRRYSDDAHCHTSLTSFFSAWRYASTVYAVIMCPSVCLSVRLSQVRVLERWLNLGSCRQRHMIA